MAVRSCFNILMYQGKYCKGSMGSRGETLSLISRELALSQNCVATLHVGENAPQLRIRLRSSSFRLHKGRQADPCVRFEELRETLRFVHKLRRNIIEVYKWNTAVKGLMSPEICPWFSPKELKRKWGLKSHDVLCFCEDRNGLMEELISV